RPAPVGDRRAHDGAPARLRLARRRASGIRPRLERRERARPVAKGPDRRDTAMDRGRFARRARGAQSMRPRPIGRYPGLRRARRSAVVEWRAAKARAPGWPDRDRATARGEPRPRAVGGKVDAPLDHDPGRTSAGRRWIELDFGSAAVPEGGAEPALTAAATAHPSGGATRQPASGGADRQKRATDGRNAWRRCRRHEILSRAEDHGRLPDRCLPAEYSLR